MSDIGLNTSLTITQAAKDHFQMLVKHEEPGMNLRMFVSNPGTVHADVSITYCPKGEEKSSDLALTLAECTLYIEKTSIEPLLDAVIDFKEEGLEGKLSIQAPHLKGHAPSEEAPFQERVEYVLTSEINPNLALHGGKVSVDSIVDGSIVVLRFSGGCQGCSMSMITLKNGIERVLKEKFPQIVEIRDVTDHTSGENPYC